MPLCHFSVYPCWSMLLERWKEPAWEDLAPWRPPETDTQEEDPGSELNFFYTIAFLILSVFFDAMWHVPWCCEFDSLGVWVLRSFSTDKSSSRNGGVWVMCESCHKRLVKLTHEIESERKRDMFFRSFVHHYSGREGAWNWTLMDIDDYWCDDRSVCQLCHYATFLFIHVDPCCLRDERSQLGKI